MVTVPDDYNDTQSLQGQYKVNKFNIMIWMSRKVKIMRIWYSLLKLQWDFVYHLCCDKIDICDIYPPPNYWIGILIHLKLCLADAIHNFKWMKNIQIWQKMKVDDFEMWFNVLIKNEKTRI